VTTDSDLVREIIVFGLEGFVLVTAGNLSFSEKFVGVVDVGLGVADGFFVGTEGESEFENLSGNFGDGVIEVLDLAEESGFNVSEGGDSVGFGLLLDVERGLEVLFDVVKDSEDGVDKGGVGDDFVALGSFGDHGDNVEDLGVTVGDTLFLEGLEGSDVGGQSGEGGGLKFEEFAFASESFSNNLSGFDHHSLDSSVFFEGTFEFFNSSGVFLSSGSEGLLSVDEFRFSVFLLVGSGSELWGVNLNESFVFGLLSLCSVDVRFEFGEISFASIANLFVVSRGLISFISEAFLDSFNHADNLADIVVGLELELDGLGKGGTELRFPDLGEDVFCGEGNGHA